MITPAGEATEVEVEIPPRSPYVGVVRLAISSLARSAGLDEEAVDDLRIAVSEACTNAVLAHEDAGLADSILVRWNEQADRVVVDIEDHRPVPGEGPVSLDSQGFSTREIMSLALLESLVDECESIDTPTGNKVRLTVARPTA